MKMKYILLSLLLVGFAPSHAQFGKLKKGLKKIKRKKKSAKKEQKKVQGRMDGEPVQNDRDPISRAHESAKSKLANIEKTVSKEGWEKDYFARGRTWIEGYFKSIRKNLDKLKADASESKKPYYKKHEEKYTQLLQQYQKAIGGAKATSDYKNLFYRWSGKLRRVSEMYITDQKFIETAEDVKYVAYKKKKEAYTASGNRSSYTDKMIAKCDEFYNKTASEQMVPRMTKVADKAVKASYKKNEGDFDEPWQQGPENCINQLNDILKSVDALEKLCVTKNVELDKIRQKLTQEKKKFEDYISSGRYKAYQAKVWQQVLDSRTMGNLGMRNAQIEGLARQAFANKGQVMRVVINSTGWGVAKNKYTSLPRYQFLNATIAVKGKDGKCYRYKGDARKEYLGGGRYGGVYIYKWDNQDEMSCANVNK